MDEITASSRPGQSAPGEARPHLLSRPAPASVTGTSKRSDRTHSGQSHGYSRKPRATAQQHRQSHLRERHARKHKITIPKSFRRLFENSPGAGSWSPSLDRRSPSPWGEGSGVRGCLAARGCRIATAFIKNRIGISTPDVHSHPLTPGPSPEGEGRNATGGLTFERMLVEATAPWHVFPLLALRAQCGVANPGGRGSCRA